MGSEVGTSVLALGQQALYRQSHLPGPNLCSLEGRSGQVFVPKKERLWPGVNLDTAPL